MGKRLDLTGKRFGKLTVLSFDETASKSIRRKHSMWLCLCDCGSIRTVVGSRIAAGKSLSCGCGRPKPPVHDTIIPGRPMTSAEYGVRTREMLTDGYVRNHLSRVIFQSFGVKISAKDVPPEMILQQRESLLLKRALRELSATIKEMMK